MTAGSSRRKEMAKARQSRRPSRLGTPAGIAPDPDYPVPPDAGFPELLQNTWRRALAAPDLATSVRTLLTLDDHVPADVQLRALRTEDEVALTVLCGQTWRDGTPENERPVNDDPVEVPGEPAFGGEIGLTTGGRLVVRVPSQPPLNAVQKLVDGVLRVPWTSSDLQAYAEQLGAAVRGRQQSVLDCRQWLADAGPDELDRMLDTLKDAALRTAPFVLYQEDKRYTNFREHNNLAGKTLWPGHPDCALSSLQSVPLELWSDNDVVVVVCLTLLVRSAGYARIEEANGTQLTLDHVALLLERTRRKYNDVPGGLPVPPAESTGPAALATLADALLVRRTDIRGRVQLFREIHGALMHKIEQVAAPYGDLAEQREAALCARLSERLPLRGASFAELGERLAASPHWLAAPHGEFATGLESLVYESVAAATEVFEADFAMSRGMRSLPQLIAALRREDWAEITKWEIASFFCCVVPAPSARRYFDDSIDHMADKAWAMSSRMQYNSWHFVAGNLPKVPVVVARDHFVPPAIPDIAYYSDQHHHGHVAAKVRFSIRSPQAVTVLDRTFNGFCDVRLLRCAGRPFTEQDLLATHRTSAFIADATTLAARLVAEGTDIEVTAFDSQWHWESITGATAVADEPPREARVS